MNLGKVSETLKASLDDVSEIENDLEQDLYKL